MKKKDRLIMKISPAKCLLMMIIFVLSTPAVYGKDKRPLPPGYGTGDLKVLFIGSNYFNINNLPGLFISLTKSDSKKVYVDYSIINNVFLDYHAESPATIDKIQQYPWDVIVLQGIGTNAAFPDTHPYIFPPYEHHELVPALKKLRKIIRKNHKPTRIVYTMPWAFRDGTTWLKGYDDSFEDMQQKIYNNILKMSKKQKFTISPAGWAWRAVINNRPDIELFLADMHHPAPAGSYLMACVVYVTVFGKSVQDNPFYGDLPADTALYLQTTAAKTVLGSLELWN
jgi:hypothetical protein